MANVLVSGLINIETTVGVERFPIEYAPVEYSFFGLDATVSGVGYNVAKALTTLGNRAQLLSIIGHDLAVASVREDLNANYIDDQFVLELAAQTARSVILCDNEGRRKILVDLKNMQDQMYPSDIVEKQLTHVQAAALCNINWSRPMLPMARKMGKLIATDVHAISDLENDYDREFMEAADILFMSDELLPVSVGEFGQAVMARYHPRVLVIGMGSKGAYMALRDVSESVRYPAIDVRGIVSTIGAGDALFSAFLHGYLIDQDPYAALQKAIIFAGYKIGTRSAAEGFLSSARLDELHRESTAVKS